MLFGAGHGLQRYVTKKVRDGFSIVGSSDGLGEDHGDVDDLEKTSSDYVQLRATIRR